MIWYKVLFGALALVGAGVCAWYLKTRGTPLTFTSFCEECIEIANKELSSTNSNEVVKAAIVLVTENSKDVVPYLYKRYSDGIVKKKKINTVPFPLDLCPDEVQDVINNGEYILRTIK